MRTISVIIPCFNAGEYLRTSVASVVAQKGRFESLEILIVDDRSTDPLTRELLREFGSKDGIKIVRNSGQRGAAGARNTGLTLARAAWVAFLDADDWWSPESLAHRFKALSEHPAASWIGGDFCDVEEGKSFDHRGRFELHLASYPFLKAAYEPRRSSLLLSNPLRDFLVGAATNTCTTMVRREVIQRLGGFAEKLLRAHDFHLWLRLAATESFLYVPEVLAYYRHHNSNSTKSYSHTLEWRIAALRDLRHLVEMAPARAELNAELARSLLGLSYEYRKEGRFRAALVASATALSAGAPIGDACKSVLASALRWA